DSLMTYEVGCAAIVSIDFLFPSSATLSSLLSFPTRRSSDLFGYPYCQAGTIVDPEFGAGHPCSNYTPPAQALAAHVAVHGLKVRSEEHTSELQSPYDLVCRLLLEKKKRELGDETRRTRRERD